MKNRNRSKKVGCVHAVAVLVLLAILSSATIVSAASAQTPDEPALTLKPVSGHFFKFVFTPYESKTAFLRIPESMYIKFAEPDKLQEVPFEYYRKDSPDYKIGDDGWWHQSESVENAAYDARVRVNKEEDRIDIEYTATNKMAVDWKYSWYRTCIAPPAPFKDPGLKRTYVVDRHGKFRKLGDMLDWDYNLISIEGDRSSATLLPPTHWGGKWRYPDLRLAETVIMTEAKDGRYTLVTAFEKAYALETGFHGPCIHSDGKTGPIPAGSKAKLRGFVALVKGNAAEGLKYYQKWKESLNQS